MAGSGRRFALEAAFLAGLAVAVGLAGLSTGRIIGVMALGWLLAVLVELVSWRLAVRHPTGVSMPVQARSASEEAAPAVAAEPDMEPRPPEVRAEEPGAEEPEPARGAQAEPVVEGPEPPRGRRRGFWRRRAAEEKTEPEPLPRHVRLIPRSAGESEANAQASPDSGTSPAERAEGA
jgi:hypothetical protein